MMDMKFSRLHEWHCFITKSYCNKQSRQTRGVMSKARGHSYGLTFTKVWLYAHGKFLCLDLDFSYVNTEIWVD